MKRNFLGVFLGMALVLGGIVGCSSDPAGNTTTPSETPSVSEEKPTSEEETPTLETEVKEELITIGFSQVGAESDWRVANTESMKGTLTEENGFKLIFADAQQKQENQIKAVRDFISQEVDVIVIAPVTETGWETVLGEARDAEIPVIIVDRMIDVSDDSLYTCWVGSDFYQEGVDSVAWLTEYMDSLGRGSDDLNVAVLQGTIGSSAEIGRTTGVQEALKDHPNYKIILEQTGEFTQAKGQEVMESFLKSGEKIDILIAQNDNMAFGAIDALKAVGQDPAEDVIIVSFDAVKAAFESMIAGDMNVSVECNPLHGPRVAELAKAIMNGDTIEKIQYVDEGVYPAETAAEILPQRAY